jgi:hypothetical protein
VNVVIPHPHMSRQHLALHFDGTRCMLEDLSGQGTLVTGKPMTRGELLDGTDLELGQWRAAYRQRGAGGHEGPTSTGRGTDVQARDSRAGVHGDRTCWARRSARTSPG